MTDTHFFVSIPGRILCATGIVALAGPGAMALAGPGPSDVTYVACIIIACIVGCAATCMLSIYRFARVSLAIGFFGPLVAGFYVAGLSLVSHAGATVGWALSLLALLPLATVVAAPLRATEAVASMKPGASVRAHG
jgi:hypothetical protein